MIEMIAGAARELKLSDPRDPATHVGPVIDAEAKARLDAHIARMTSEARVHLAATRARRQLCRAASVRTVRRGQAHRGSVRTDPPRGALWRRPARPGALPPSRAPATG